ncbi:MAG: hypothetical protein OEY63_00175 [Gemmatimonadota bacterium]|nr:hypothetical protein [Gemmatimonadota bacterium]
MSFVALLLVAQSAWTSSPQAATIGDTIQLTRVVEVDEAVSGVSARPLERTNTLEPLRAPEVNLVAGRVSIRYWVALFEPGLHNLRMPDLEVTFAGGRVELVSGGFADVTVVPTLPEEVENVERRRPRAPVARSVRDFRAVFLFAGVAILSILLWAFFTRRVKPRPKFKTASPELIEPNVHDWLAAGESRAVASVASDNLRKVVALLIPSAHRALSTSEVIEVLKNERENWPLEELHSLLTVLEDASYSPIVGQELAALATSAHYLSQNLQELELERAHALDGTAD